MALFASAALLLAAPVLAQSGGNTPRPTNAAPAGRDPRLARPDFLTPNWDHLQAYSNRIGSNLSAAEAQIRDGENRAKANQFALAEASGMRALQAMFWAAYDMELQPTRIGNYTGPWRNNRMRDMRYAFGNPVPGDTRPAMADAHLPKYSRLELRLVTLGDTLAQNGFPRLKQLVGTLIAYTSATGEEKDRLRAELERGQGIPPGQGDVPTNVGPTTPVTPVTPPVTNVADTVARWRDGEVSDAEVARNLLALDDAALRAALATMSPEEIARLIARMSEADRNRVLGLLDPAKRAAVERLLGRGGSSGRTDPGQTLSDWRNGEVTDRQMADALRTADDATAARLLSDMTPEEIARLLRLLSSADRDRLLALLPPDIRSRVEQILGLRQTTTPTTPSTGGDFSGGTGGGDPGRNPFTGRSDVFWEPDLNRPGFGLGVEFTYADQPGGNLIEEHVFRTERGNPGAMITEERKQWNLVVEQVGPPEAGEGVYRVMVEVQDFGGRSDFTITNWQVSGGGRVVERDGVRATIEFTRTARAEIRAQGTTNTKPKGSPFTTEALVITVNVN